MCDAQAGKNFLIDLRLVSGQKGAPTLDLENYWAATLLHIVLHI
jgi:hypothetical protein